MVLNPPEKPMSGNCAFFCALYSARASGGSKPLPAVAQAQKAGGEVAFVDAEHALDPAYARALGVNVDDMQNFRARPPVVTSGLPYMTPTFSRS